MLNEQKGSTNNKNALRQDRYETEVEGVSMKTLETGLWIVKNRHNLWRMFIFTLVAVSVISWGYTLFGFGSYLFFGMRSDAEMVKKLVQNKIISHDYLVQTSAKNIIFSTTGIIANEGKYDLYAQVKNPNPKHFGLFSFCFLTSGGEKSCGKDFILPGETKYVFALSQNFKNQPSSVAFSVSDLAWQKIDGGIIPDWKKYYTDHLNISVSNTILTPAASNEISEKIDLNSLSFTATNNTAFSYWEAPFTIVLSYGGRIISLNRYVINNFTSHDSKEIKITWPGTINSASSISITPDINIMDNGVYRQPNE